MRRPSLDRWVLAALRFVALGVAVLGCYATLGGMILVLMPSYHPEVEFSQRLGYLLLVLLITIAGFLFWYRRCGYGVAVIPIAAMISVMTFGRRNGFLLVLIAFMLFGLVMHFLCKRIGRAELG